MTHLALVAVLVPEYDEGIAFFCGTLGFALLEDTDMGAGKRWVRVAPEGAQTEFLLARAVGKQRATIGVQGGGRVWLFLRTQNFDQYYNALCAADVPFEGPVRDEAYGRVAVFRDPWGNRWDLLSDA